MKRLFQNTISIILVLSCISCSQESSSEASSQYEERNDESATSEAATNTVDNTEKEENSRDVIHYGEGDILVVSNENGAFPNGSYLSMIKGDEAIKSGRIIRVLNEVGADQSFISFVEPRLESNRRLQNDSFTLPLTDEHGNVHSFEYIANDDENLYTLNYQFQSADK